MGIEDELTGSQLIGPIKKVLTFTDQELTTEEQSLRSYIWDRIFPTSRHEKLARLKKGEHEDVAAEVVAISEQDEKIRKDLARLVNEIHVAVYNANSQGPTTVGQATTVNVYNFYFNASDSTDVLTIIKSIKNDTNETNRV